MSDFGGDTILDRSAQSEMNKLESMLQKIRISGNPSMEIKNIVQIFLANGNVGPEFKELINSIYKEYPQFDLDKGNWKIIFVHKLIEFLIENAKLTSVEPSSVIANLNFPENFKKDCEDAKQQIYETEEEIKGFITDAANAKTVALLTTARNEMQKRRGQGVLYVGPLSDSENLSKILQNHFFPFSHFTIKYSPGKRGFFVYAKNSQDVQGIPSDARSIELLTNPPLPLLSEYTSAIKNLTDKETGSEGFAQAALRKLKNLKKRAEVAKPFVAIGVNYAVNFIPVVGRAYSTLSTIEQKISKYGKQSTFRTSSGFEWHQDIRVIEIDGVTSVIAYDLSDQALKERGEVYLARQWAIEEAGLTVDPKIFLGIEQILYSLGDQKDNIGKLKDLNRIFARGLIKFLSDKSYYYQVLGPNPDPPYANLFRKSDDGKSIILNAYQIEKLIRRIKNLEDKKILGSVAGQEFLIALNALRVDELSDGQVLNDAERICEGNLNLIEKLSGLNKSNVARATIAGVGAAAGITAGVSAATVGVLTSFDAIMSAGEVAINLDERKQKEIIKRISLENLDELSDEELTKRVAEISEEVAVKTSKELIVAMASYFILSRLLLRGSVAGRGGNGTMQATGDFMGRGLIILTKTFLAKREFERKNNTEVKTAAEVVAWLRNDTETFYELRNFISGMSMAAGVSRSVESFTHETMASMVVKLIPKGTVGVQANDFDLSSLNNTTTGRPLDESGCFLAGTLIAISSGNIKIEELKVEDHVFGFNISTQKIEEQKISEVFAHNVQGYYKLTTKSGISINVTAPHRIYIGEENFLEVEKLEVGAKIFSKSENEITSDELILKEYFDETVQVYNFTTLPDHTYFANGILAHNVKAVVVREESLAPKLNTPEGQEKLFDKGPEVEHGKMKGPKEEFRVENVYRLFAFGNKTEYQGVHFATAGLNAQMIDDLEKRVGKVDLSNIKGIDFSNQEKAILQLKDLGFTRQEAYTFCIVVKNPATYEYIYNGYAIKTNNSVITDKLIATPQQFANTNLPEQYPNTNLSPATPEDLKTATQYSKVNLEQQVTETDKITIKVGVDYATLREGIDLKLKDSSTRNNVIGQVLADILSSKENSELLRNRVHGSDLVILQNADYNDILKSISLLQKDPASKGFGVDQTIFKAVKNVFDVTRDNPNTLVILLHNTITHETHLKRSDLDDVFISLNNNVYKITSTGIRINTPATLLIANDSHAELEINTSIKNGNAPEGSFLSHKDPYTPEIHPKTPGGSDVPELTQPANNSGAKVNGNTVEIGDYRYIEIAPNYYSLLDKSGKQISEGTIELIKLNDGNYYVVRHLDKESLFRNVTSVFQIKNGIRTEIEVTLLPDGKFFYKNQTGIDGLILYTEVTKSGESPKEYYHYKDKYFDFTRTNNGADLIGREILKNEEVDGLPYIVRDFYILSDKEIIHARIVTFDNRPSIRIFIDDEGNIMRSEGIEELDNNNFQYKNVKYRVDKQGNISIVEKILTSSKIDDKGEQPKNVNTPIPTRVPPTTTPSPTSTNTVIPVTAIPSATITATATDIPPTYASSPTSSATTADVLPIETKPAATSTGTNTPEPIKPSATPSATNTVIPTDVPPTSTVAATETLAVMTFQGKSLQYDQSVGGYVWEKLEGTLGDKTRIVFKNDGDQIPDQIIKVTSSGDKILDRTVRVSDSSNPNIIYFIDSEDTNLHTSFVKVIINGTNIDVQDQTGTILIETESNKFAEVNRIGQWFIDSNNVLYQPNKTGIFYETASSFQAVAIEDGIIVIVNSEGKIVAFTQNYVYGGEQEPLDYISINQKFYKVTGKSEDGKYIVQLVEEPTTVPTNTNTPEPTANNFPTGFENLQEAPFHITMKEIGDLTLEVKNGVLLEDGNKIGYEILEANGDKYLIFSKAKPSMSALEDYIYVWKKDIAAWGNLTEDQDITLNGHIYRFLAGDDGNNIKMIATIDEKFSTILFDFNTNGDSFEKSLYPSSLTIGTETYFALDHNLKSIPSPEGFAQIMVSGAGQSKKYHVISFLNGAWYSQSVEDGKFSFNGTVYNIADYDPNYPETTVANTATPSPTNTSNPTNTDIPTQIPSSTPSPTNTEIPSLTPTATNTIEQSIAKIDVDKSKPGTQLSISGDNLLGASGEIIGVKISGQNIYRLFDTDVKVYVNNDDVVVYYPALAQNTFKIIMTDGTVYYYNSDLSNFYKSDTNPMKEGKMVSKLIHGKYKYYFTKINEEVMLLSEPLPTDTATSTETATTTPSPTNTATSTDVPLEKVTPSVTAIPGKGIVITLPEGEMPEVLAKMDTNSSTPGIQLILDSDVIRNASGIVIARKSLLPNSYILETIKGGIFIKDQKIDTFFETPNIPNTYTILIDSKRYYYNIQLGSYFEDWNTAGMYNQINNPNKFIILDSTDGKLVMLRTDLGNLYNTKNDALYADNVNVGTSISNNNFWLNDGRDNITTNGKTIMVSNGVYDNGNFQVSYYKSGIPDTILMVFPNGSIYYYDYIGNAYYDSNKRILQNKYIEYEGNVFSFSQTNEDHPKLVLASSELDKKFVEDVYNKSRNILLGLGALGGVTALGAYGTNLALKKRARQKNINKYVETQIPVVQDQQARIKEKADNVWDDPIWK